MIYQFTKRTLKETDKRLLWKLAFNFGWKGMRSVQLYKKRLKQGVHFPPFLFISIINSCQLRCQGCWVDVESPRKMIELEEMNRLIDDAKRHGNSYFGILGGEPFLHPHLLDILAAHPRAAERARRLGGILHPRGFIVEMRGKLPIAIVEPYWDHNGEALCPMSTGVSHHIGPGGDVEPCPIIQFATENIKDKQSVYELMTGSEVLRDFRET